MTVDRMLVVQRREDNQASDFVLPWVGFGARQAGELGAALRWPGGGKKGLAPLDPSAAG